MSISRRHAIQIPGHPQAQLRGEHVGAGVGAADPDQAHHGRNQRAVTRDAGEQLDASRRIRRGGRRRSSRSLPSRTSARARDRRSGGRRASPGSDDRTGAAAKGTTGPRRGARWARSRQPNRAPAHGAHVRQPRVGRPSDSKFSPDPPFQVSAGQPARLAVGQASSATGTTHLPRVPRGSGGAGASRSTS